MDKTHTHRHTHTHALHKAKDRVDLVLAPSGFLLSPDTHLKAFETSPILSALSLHNHTAKELESGETAHARGVHAVVSEMGSNRGKKPKSPELKIKKPQPILPSSDEVSRAAAWET